MSDGHVIRLELPANERDRARQIRFPGAIIHDIALSAR